MPKIKLSGLVSDIKGKANGSVFARNSGGLYYRNNPSGGGQKTAKWAKAKAKFSSMAGKWRELSEVQQEAWNAAVSNYNAKDAFGDDRIPSGYELFMRLNQPLNNIGRSVMVLPPSPVSYTDYGNMALVTTDTLLFVPNVGYAPHNCQADDQWLIDQVPVLCDPDSDLNDDCYIGATDPDDTVIPKIDRENPLVISGLFLFNKKSIVVFEDSEFIPLTRWVDDKPGIQWRIHLSSSEEYVVELQFNSDQVVNKVDFSIPAIDLNVPLRISVRVDIGSPGKSVLYLNKKPYAAAPASFDLDELAFKDVPFSFVPSLNEIISPITLQHSFLSNENADQFYMGKLIYGYSVGSPFFLLGYEQNESGEFKNHGSVRPEIKISFPRMNNIKKSFVKVDYEIAPWLVLINEFSGVSERALFVETSPMGSSGRIGTRSGFKRIAFENTDNRSIIDVGEAFLNEWGAIIQNSFIQVQVRELILSTGQLSSPRKINFVLCPDNFGPQALLPDGLIPNCPEGFELVDGMCVHIQYKKDPSRMKKNKKVKFKAGSQVASSVNANSRFH